MMDKHAKPIKRTAGKVIAGYSSNFAFFLEIDSKNHNKYNTAITRSWRDIMYPAAPPKWPV
jgi:hypothetical protein